MERTFSDKEVRKIGRTIKLSEFFIITGWRLLNKMAIKYGFKDWADMSNQCGW